MSNKEKFLQVIATMAQPSLRNSRVAWKEAEAHWDEHMKLVNQLSREELLDLVNYAIMGMHMLSNKGRVEMFHDVILDDLKQVVHDRTCPKCKDKPESECDSEDSEATTGGDAGPEGTTEFRTFSSMAEFFENITGGKKPPN